MTLHINVGEAFVAGYFTCVFIVAVLVLMFGGGK